jgi:nicotinamide riboside kinase
MLRIGFTGVPGSGKTSTARALAAEMKKNGYNIELVEEYARRYISKHGQMDKVWEQYRITAKQVEWEDSVIDKVELIITDSPIFLGFLYASDIPKTDAKDVMVFNDLFKLLARLNFPKPRYDMLFHIPPTIKPADDGIRAKHHLEDKWRSEADTYISSIFKIFPQKIIYTVEPVKLEERVKFCMDKVISCCKLEKGERNG